MRTPLLIEVPRTHPSNRVRLTEFKRKHGILTHHAPHLPKEYETWLALKPFAEDAGKDIGDIMAESCRLYEESNYCATSNGEFSAVKKLCEQIGIPFDL